MLFLLSEMVYVALGMLDRIPRYGRLYTLPFSADGKILRDRSKWTCEWKWQSRGMWGFALSKVLGLGSQYLIVVDESEEDDERG